MPEDSMLYIPVTEIAEGAMRVYTVHGREVLVCRTKEGTHALDNICTHAYARLCDGRLRGTRLICPLHGASFDVRDGTALGAPATKPLATHPGRVVDDRIEVTITTADGKPSTPR